MLFLLASVAANIIFGQINTTLPDQGAPPPAQANDPPSRPTSSPWVSPSRSPATRSRCSRSRAWRARSAAPKAASRGPAALGDQCDANYQCETNKCGRLRTGKDPVTGKPRPTSRRCSTTAPSTTRSPRSPPALGGPGQAQAQARDVPGGADGRPVDPLRHPGLGHQLDALQDAAVRHRRPRDLPDADRRRGAEEGQGPGRLQHRGCTIPTASTTNPTPTRCSRTWCSRRGSADVHASEARSMIRKAVKRVPEGEEIRHLNIMPMMDMMTILLVAFISQIAVASNAADGQLGRLAGDLRRAADARDLRAADHHQDRASSSRARRSSPSATATSTRRRRRAAPTVARSRKLSTFLGKLRGLHEAALRDERQAGARSPS
jgi:hypothetical protein